MKTILFSVYIAEFIAALLASIFYFKYRNTPLKFFVIYLWYVFINEISAYFLLPKGLIKFELTNLYGLITVVFVIFMCREFVAHKLKRRLLLLAIAIVCIMTLTEFFLKGINEPWTVSKIAAPLIGLVALFTYLLSLFQISSVLNPFRELFTYFLIGFTLFFVASPVILIARIYYQGNMSMSANLTYVMAFIAILMYSIFSFGFIWSEKRSS